MIRILIAAFALFISVLIANIPASMVLKGCDVDSRLACGFSNSAGTIWQGSVTGLEVAFQTQGVRFDRLAWDIDLLALFRGQLSVEVKAETMGGDLRSMLSFEREQFTVESTRIHYPMSLNGFSGNVLANIERTVLNYKGVMSELSGTYIVQGGRLDLNGESFDLGDINGELSQQEQNVLISADNGAAELGVKGGCDFNQLNYACELDFDTNRISNSGLANSLRSGARERLSGVYQVQFEGRL